MMNKIIVVLLVGIAVVSCNSSTEENPLKNLKKGLWVPNIENFIDYQLIKSFSDMPDSTYMQPIPFWIIGDDCTIITKRTSQNFCFDQDFKINEDGEWAVQYDDCVFKTNDAKNLLICFYRDAKNNIHQIEYRHCIEKSLLSLEQFWLINEQLANTVWQEKLAEKQGKNYIFLADTAIDNSPNQDQKIYKYPLVLDSINQQLSDDRKEFKSMDFLFVKELVLIKLDTTLFVLNTIESDRINLLKIGQKDERITWVKDTSRTPFIDSIIYRFNHVKSLN